jgi:hypothetical protein
VDVLVDGTDGMFELAIGGWIGLAGYAVLFVGSLIGAGRARGAGD